VDHVLRGQGQLDGLAHREVELVDLALTRRVLGLPHPLLAGDVVLRGVRRRTVETEVDLGAPDEGEEHDEQRNDRPGDLEDRRLVERRADLVLALAAVPHREDEDHDRDPDREEGAHPDQPEGQGVDVARERRSRLGEERKIERHG